MLSTQLIACGCLKTKTFQYTPARSIRVGVVFVGPTLHSKYNLAGKLDEFSAEKTAWFLNLLIDFERWGTS